MTVISVPIEVAAIRDCDQPPRPISANEQIVIFRKGRRNIANISCCDTSLATARSARIGKDQVQHEEYLLEPT
jgi:hypothetical protein